MPCFVRKPVLSDDSWETVVHIILIVLNFGGTTHGVLRMYDHNHEHDQEQKLDYDHARDEKRDYWHDPWQLLVMHHLD